VTIDQVDQALDRRDIRFDIAVVFVPMVVFLALISHMAASRVYEHAFDNSPHIKAIAVVSLVLASVILSAVNVPVGEMWSGLVEAFRVRNGHMGGIRALRLPWAQHRIVIFVGGIALFWLVALYRYRAMCRHHTE
jgi:hypothetical protein